jgi:hypothetical protein
MTVTDVAPDPGGSGPEAPARRRSLLVIAVVIAALLAAIVAFALVSDDDGASFARHDVAAMRRAERACQEWLEDRDGTKAQADADRCRHLGDWMYDRMGEGRMGPMMWGSPTAMRDTCMAAMGTYRREMSARGAWCRDMVDWMRGQAGDDDWRGWMMNPSMMRR